MRCKAFFGLLAAVAMAISLTGCNPVPERQVVVQTPAITDTTVRNSIDASLGTIHKDEQVQVVCFTIVDGVKLFGIVLHGTTAADRMTTGTIRGEHMPVGFIPQKAVDSAGSTLTEQLLAGELKKRFDNIEADDDGHIRSCDNEQIIDDREAVALAA